MKKDYKQRVTDLVFNEETWLPSNDYLSLRMFCLKELAAYDVDPTSSNEPVSVEMLKKHNLSGLTSYRIEILVAIYFKCLTFLKLKTMTLHPNREFTLEACELSYQTGSASASLITYALMNSAGDNITKEEFDEVMTKLTELKAKNHNDRGNGGRAKAETDAKEASRQMAVALLAKNSSYTKPELIQKILAEMERNKDQFGLRRNIPSFDTLNKWLTNLDRS
ncbi:hypothetical protein [Paraglaciecola chathamensis]|uniref:Uncharacterized protein n=1 Tax=Paraglaciecola agarilytica NO2 TaxID=1125747 RepID=A0ABQ0IC59_9ALTE|nr:hypothetical protein [Paraglaciecola agarilytica]GAC06954.1 hypothetical protein GAGA_4122 [Paraglaciecola agarilytica NO2]